MSDIFFTSDIFICQSENSLYYMFFVSIVMSITIQYYYTNNNKSFTMIGEEISLLVFNCPQLLAPQP